MRLQAGNITYDVRRILGLKLCARTLWSWLPGLIMVFWMSAFSLPFTERPCSEVILLVSDKIVLPGQNPTLRVNWVNIIKSIPPCQLAVNWLYTWKWKFLNYSLALLYQRWMTNFQGLKQTGSYRGFLLQYWLLSHVSSTFHQMYHSKNAPFKLPFEGMGNNFVIVCHNIELWCSDPMKCKHSLTLVL